jgi:programmed cell death protein 4
VDVALDHEPAGRELYSQLLAKIQVDQLVDEPSFELAFDTLVDRVEDLLLDVPDAVDALAKFIARCVADDCLPPAYVSHHHLYQQVTRSRHQSRHEEVIKTPDTADESEEEVIVTTPAHYVLRKAHKLLTMHHAMPRLDQVWGVCGPQLPVSALRKRVKLLIDEFLSSQDLAEAERCLKDLAAPHFHHELVYQTLCRIMECGYHADVASGLAKLLEYLSTTNDISEAQMNEGTAACPSQAGCCFPPHCSVLYCIVLQCVVLCCVVLCCVVLCCVALHCIA